ncbi:MAG: hypothetical protein HC918_09315 [Oscillatoriales cyanobacterium SM2_1_8]|nr:hypothetical protein [Oscillatoriales cyanobacterium SM2_1_8]
MAIALHNLPLALRFGNHNDDGAPKSNALSDMGLLFFEQYGFCSQQYCF